MKKSFNKDSLCQFLIFLCSVFSYNFGYAQFESKTSFLPPSPNASSIIRYANTPVNMYTGIPSISTDLHVLKARGEYSIPISFFYHAGGNKVQDVASNIGLGWSLNVNSLIARVVRGLPDEKPNAGYFATDMGAKVLQPLSVETMTAIIDNTLDAEPDLFYYNINGQFGQFVFDKDKNPVILQDNGIKILNSPFKQEFGINGWVLGDMLGNKYYLGMDEGTKEITNSKINLETSFQNEEFVSSWYLKSIVTSNNLNNIQFNYDTGGEIKVINYNKRKKHRIKYTTTFYKGFLFFPPYWENYTEITKNEWNSNIEETFSSPKYLSSIVSSNESAYFYYDLQNLRQDLPNGRALKKIEIKNYQNQVLESFSFLQEYIYTDDKERLYDLLIKSIEQLSAMMSDASNRNDMQQLQLYGEQKSSLIQVKDNFPNLSEAECIAQMETIISSAQMQPYGEQHERYRLRLNGIHKNSSDNTSFIPIYHFKYNDEFKLPPRYSYKADHYGYYNNNTTGYLLEPDFQNGEFKNSHLDRMKAGILNRITFETGGYKDFIFEAKEYYDQISSSNQIAGGLRIAKIITTGGHNTPPLISEYKYRSSTEKSTGKLICSKPIYLTYLDHNESQIYYPPPMDFQPVNIPTFTQMRGDMVLPVSMKNQAYLSVATGLINYTFGGQSTTKYSPFVLQSSVSLNTLFDLGGANIGYSEVTVKNSGEGFTISRFTDLDDYADESKQIRVDTAFTATGRLSPNVSPFAPTTSYAFARGHLKEMLVYDKNSTLLKRVVNNYTFSNNSTSVIGLRCALGKVNVVNGAFSSYNTQYFDIGYYEYIAKSLLLTQTTEESWESTSATPLTVANNYSYYDFGNLIKSQSSQQSDGSTLLTEYKYVLNKDLVSYSLPSEIASANALYEDGRLAILLEQTTKKNNVIIDISKVGYKSVTVNSKVLIVPDIVYSGRSAASVKMQYHDYDEFGNVLKMSSKGGPMVSTKWGYNHLYPVAEVHNAEPGEFFIEDFEEANGVTVGNAHSGKKYFTGDYPLDFNPINSKPYKLTYWYLENGVWKFSGVIPYTSSLTLANGYPIDDVKVIPEDAYLSTVSYDPTAGISSSTDLKGLTSSYSYDEFGRLKTIKDDRGNILKHYVYNQASTPVPNVFLNSLKSQNFTKSCSQGVGTVVPYTVPEAKYYSYNSQSEADAQAQNEINANGQLNANNKGKCSVFARLELTNQRWVNDGYYNKVIADATISFYWDSNGNIPATVYEDFEVKIKTDYVWSDGIDQWENYVNYEYYTIFSGSSKVSIGTLEIEGYHNYYDSFYQNNFEEGFSNTYEIMPPLTNNIYVPSN